MKSTIDSAIRMERELTRSILIELIGELRQETSDDMADALKALAIEVTDLRATVAELRLALCDIRSKEPLNLPDAFRTKKTN